jgi:hypothetical protein
MSTSLSSGGYEFDAPTALTVRDNRLTGGVTMPLRDQRRETGDRHARVGTIGTRAMLAAFAALGLDAGRIQADAGFSDDELTDPDRLLPAGRFYRMWEAADREWARPALGPHAGGAVRFVAYEILDHLLSSAATIGDGLAQLAAYYAITTRTSRYLIDQEHGFHVCEMVWRLPPRGVMFQLRDYSLAVMSGRVARLAGRREGASRRSTCETRG